MLARAGELPAGDGWAYRVGSAPLWDTPEDEASTRPGRLAMHDGVSAAAGMSLVDYEVYDLPVLEVVGTGLRT